jgi:YVTN family beta-propeller protein
VVSTTALVEKKVVPVGPAPVQLCAADGGKVIAALANGGTRLTLLEGDSADVRATIEVGSSPYSAIARGPLLYVAMHAEPPAECLDAVHVVDVTTARVVATIVLPPNSRAKRLVGAFERERMYSLNWGNGTVTEIDSATHTPLRSIEVGRGPRYAKRSLGVIYIANGQSNDVAVLDEASFTIKQRVPVGRCPVRCVTGKDRLAVINLEDDSVSFIGVDDGTVAKTVPVGHEPIRVTYWPSRGRDEWAVLSRASQDSANGVVTFIDGETLEVTERVGLPGPAANWNWGPGPHHQMAYITLAGEPTLAIMDGVRAEVVGTTRLSHSPEPSGNGQGLGVSSTDGVFIANAGDTRGEGSVTVLRLT